MSRTRPARALLAGLGIATLAAAGMHQPAAAERPPAILVSGLGPYVIDTAGSAVVSADGVFERRGRTGEPVQIAATLAAADGTLPAPGDCEPASATFVVSGARGRDLVLAGSGEVCGEFVQLPLIVTHAFTGRYDIVAGPGGLTGTDGFFEVRLGNNGQASVFAIDT